MHLVHYNADLYHDAATATKSRDGLCVLGVFLELCQDDNRALLPITDLLSKVERKGSSVKLDDCFNVKGLLPCLSDYWTYPGSLTTPPLYETVTWIVFKETIGISHAQLEALRSLKDAKGHQIAGNFRPTCRLCDRIVRASFSCCSD